MRVDASEIKTFRECGRKHQLSSRNRFHLRPLSPNDNLVFGTQFHECLAMMYLGTSLDKILEFINREVKDSVYWKTMDTMVKGYYNGPYQQDKDRYVVVDIEKSFNYKLCDVVNPDTGEIEDLVACGSIDMVCIDVETGRMVGFEHKTTKNFRPDIYNLIDEQPHLYTWALKKILEDYHTQGKYLEITETGPILINQVRKLQTKFDYLRVPCNYSARATEKFMASFVESATKIYLGQNNQEEISPGYMKCQMCDYATICLHYGYDDIDKEDLLQEFDGEFAVREADHLDEKTQRHVEDSD